MTQEPKYDFRDGRIINRATGEAIPLDEPVMVFRGRDRHAAEALLAYMKLIENPKHIHAVSLRLADFGAFAVNHPERMKEPDTEPWWESQP